MASRVKAWAPFHVWQELARLTCWRNLMRSQTAIAKILSCSPLRKASSRPSAKRWRCTSASRPRRLSHLIQYSLPSDTGAWLATRGRWADQVPACAQCHGPGGSGVGAQFPPLAGLPAAYIAEQLQAWKAGSRPPGPLALMAGVAKKLSDAEISAVAAYYEKIAAPDRTAVPRAVSVVPGAAVTPGALNPAAPAQTKGSP